MNMIWIFDLDGTVIDSSHRQLYDKKTGALNLDKWIENSTPEKVAQDSLMPLADFWQNLIQETNDYIMVCTARVLADADREYLVRHGLIADKIFSRPLGCSTKDHELKVAQLNPFLSLKQFANKPKIMFDDNANVRKAVGDIGIMPINPEEFAIA